MFVFRHEVLCDIKLETDEGIIICGHKVVLASASPYFQAMFTHFAEKNKDHVVIRELDSITLQLLVDFIYSGKIMVTENNVQVIIDTFLFLFRQYNYLNCLFFIFQEFVTSGKSLATTRNKGGMLWFFTDTTALYKLSWCKSVSRFTQLSTIINKFRIVY